MKSQLTHEKMEVRPTSLRAELEEAFQFADALCNSINQVIEKLDPILGKMAEPMPTKGEQSENADCEMVNRTRAISYQLARANSLLDNLGRRIQL